MIKYRSEWEVIALFGVSLLFFTWGLSAQEIIGFESRFYLFAQEMWRNGPSWFPTTYNQPYPDYPGTSTFLIYLVATCGGGLNKLTATLPSAIAAAITVVFTYLIGALHSKRWGLIAVFFLFLTITFFKSARSLTLDMYPTMVTAWCFYLVYAADQKNKARLILWIFPLLLLSFAFRGPIGLVIPTGVVCVYYLLKRDIKKLIIVGFSALILLALCTYILLFLAHHVGGDAFMQDVLRMEVSGRIDNSYQPIYFYLVDGLGNYALSFPLALLTLIGVVFYTARRNHIVLPERQFLFYLLGWMLIILFGMTIPGDKKIRYILPMVPATALLAAYFFVAPATRKYFSILRNIIVQILFFLPAILALVTESVFYYAQKNEVNLAISYQTIAVWLLVLQGINFGLYYRYQKRAQSRDFAVPLIAALSFILVEMAIVEPIELYIDRANQFVVTMETQRTRHHAQLVFYKERPDGLPIKYIINMPAYQEPIFLDNEQDLLQFSKPAYFVTSVDYFDALPQSAVERFRIVANDTLGHARVVVFTNK